MKTKIFFRIIAMVLTLFMCFSTLPVWADIYSPGPTEYELDKSLLLESNEVTISEGKLILSAGGSVKFDLLLPFVSDSLTITYEAITKDTALSIATDEHSYSTTLLASATTNTVAITELLGSNTITLTANGAVTITSVLFNKINENYSDKNSADIPLTDYEYATLTSVIFKDDAAALKTRGAVQHLDIENIRLTPMNIDGRLYVPFTKLAESLGYYCEDYPDKAYIYMAGETESLALIGGKGYIESDESGKTDFSLSVIYKGDKTWVPVRALAEALGFAVEYKDGFVVIDDRLTAKNVIEDETIFAELATQFSAYIPGDTVEGKTYYVDGNAANNSSLGTQEAPFLTIQEAADVAKAGDTVIIHAGTYRETVTFDKNDGTALNPITFKSAGDGDVIISALDKLTGFTAYEGDIIKASVPTDLGFGRNQLFYKGEALNAGRHPNSDKTGVVPYPEGVPEGVYATRGDIRITQEGGNIAYSDSGLLDQDEANYWKGGTFVTLKGQGWSLASGEIIASQKGQITLADHTGTKSYNLGLVGSPTHDGAKFYKKVTDSDYGYITNHLNTVDSEGEWFMDSDEDIMYVIPPENANPETDFEVKQRQLCIDLRGRKYIIIDGIDTIGGGITMSGDSTEGCVLNDGEFRYIAHHSVLLDQSNYAMTSGEELFSLETMKAGEAGICIAGKNNAIVNSKIDYSSATGINLLGKYHYINNNIISNTSYSGAYPGGIYVLPDLSKGEAAADEVFGGHFITYNTLSNAGRSLILLCSTVDDVVLAAVPVEIAYNRIYNGALSSRDTGITYEYGFTGGNDKSKTRMHHNFIYNPGYKDAAGPALMMLYHDDMVAARETYNNVLYYEEADKTPLNQIFVHDTKNAVIRDRNNSELGYLYGGEADITRSDFPGARRFSPGADHDSYARSLDSYNDLKADSGLYYPDAVSQDSKTYTFENVNIEQDVRTEIGLYMNRKVGSSDLLTVTTRVYDQNNTLVNTTKLYNEATTSKFYVYDLHKGISVVEPMDSGIYNIEIEFSDSTVDLNKIIVESFDANYDNLYTREMEEAGIVGYLPASSTEASGQETVTFENVYIESGKKIILDTHVTRDCDPGTQVELTAEIYNSSGTKVDTVSLVNVFKHSQYNTFEALSGKIALPELATSGNYKVVIKLSDTYSKVLRLVAEEASGVYENLFNENVYLGGSFDSWAHNPALNTGYSITSAAGSIEPENIEKYLHYSATVCRSHIITYEDRQVASDSNYLRITTSAGSTSCGGTVKLYVDKYSKYSPSSYTPIATWVIENTSWKPKAKYVELSTELLAGEHTFYLVFEADSNTKAATLWNFSFCNEAWDGESLSELNAQ